MAIVSGGKELERALKQLPKTLQNRAINKATRKAAAIVVKQARSNAPTKTGALKRNLKSQSWPSRFFARVYSIGVEHGPIPKPAGDGLGVIRSRGGKLTIRKTTARERRGEDPFYYGWQELGWTHAKGGRKIPPREYLRKALKTKEREAIETFGNVLRDEIARLGS